MDLKTYRRTLKLKHTFTIARGSSDERENVFVTLQHDGITAYGEAAPNIRYGETPESCIRALDHLKRELHGADPRAYRPLIERILSAIPGEFAAKAALDMALHDWVARSLRVPLHRLWGLDPDHSPATGMTIGIDSPAKLVAKVREAADFPSLKVKLGSSDDRAIIGAIRGETDRPILADANEGWTNREQAIREIEWLANQNVTLIEQPMPADQWEDMVWLKARSPLPLIADEGFTVVGDMAAIGQAYHGINIKLMKCGGLLAALQIAAVAKALNLHLMLGCMVESSLAIAAGAQIAPLMDSIDLDGNRLLINDPFTPIPLQRGRFSLPPISGLGTAPV